MLRGTKTFLSERPKIAEQWHPTKNTKGPNEYAPQSNKHVWWQCEKEHEWEASISGRFSRGHGCPYCSHQKVLFETSLQHLFPDIAREWDTKKNNKTPSDVMAHSGKKIWWKCSHEHSWEVSIHARTSGRRGCPYCAGQRASDANSLAVCSPELSKQWHPTKNGLLTPRSVTKRSKKKVWWICLVGHEWEATVDNRHNTNCPKCRPLIQQGVSTPQICWLDRISAQKNINIIHKKNNDGKEHSILVAGKRTNVDGYCEKTKTIYEFMGCYWHGHNPAHCKLNRKYAPLMMNKSCKKTFGNLYNTTIMRLNKLKELGYNVVVMWECNHSLNLAKNKRKTEDDDTLSFDLDLFFYGNDYQ